MPKGSWPENMIKGNLELLPEFAVLRLSGFGTKNPVDLCHSTQNMSSFYTACTVD